MDKRKKSRKQSGSPSADYSAGSANRSGGAPLYRAALERSVRKRAVAAETTMQDITNVVASGSRLNESLADTERKKGRALIAYHKHIQEITPRTAIMEMHQAYAGERESGRKFFPETPQQQQEQQPQQQRGTRTHNLGSSYIREPEVLSNYASALFDSSENSSSADFSSTSPVMAKKRFRTAGKQRESGVNPDDLDPDRDITRPTNRTGNETAQLTLSDLDLTEMPPPRKRPKRVHRKVTAKDFEMVTDRTGGPGITLSSTLCGMDRTSPPPL